jgi:hypothetical protein
MAINDVGGEKHTSRPDRLSNEKSGCILYGVATMWLLALTKIPCLQRFPSLDKNIAAVELR